MLGERIRQARLLAGWTQEQLAEALKTVGYDVTKAVISNYENNKRTPPAQFLMMAASVLNVPGSYFVHEPAKQVSWLAFRKHSTLPKGEQATVQAYAADVAELQIELQQLLYPDARANLPERVPVSSPEEAEEAAARLRIVWSLDDNPIDSLVQTAESHHVVVVGWDKFEGDFDGLSGWCDNSHPITVINTSVAMDRRRFTLAHELGHLLMDTSAVPDREAERLAHRFAAALLAPKTRVLHELGRRRTNLDWDEIGILKRKYGLSMAAWIFRAMDLQVITAHYARLLFTDLSQRGWRKEEPVEFRADETPVQLEQMAHRAIAEGLVSTDRIERAYPAWDERQTTDREHDRLTVYDLMAMPVEDQQRIMSEAFALAADEDFEIFEANELWDEDEVPE